MPASATDPLSKTEIESIRLAFNRGETPLLVQVNGWTVVMSRHADIVAVFDTFPDPATLWATFLSWRRDNAAAVLAGHRIAQGSFPSDPNANSLAKAGRAIGKRGAGRGTALDLDDLLTDANRDESPGETL